MVAGLRWRERQRPLGPDSDRTDQYRPGQGGVAQLGHRALKGRKERRSGPQEHTDPAPDPGVVRAWKTLQEPRDPAPAG